MYAVYRKNDGNWLIINLKLEVTECTQDRAIAIIGNDIYIACNHQYIHDRYITIIEYLKMTGINLTVDSDTMTGAEFITLIKYIFRSASKPLPILKIVTGISSIDAVNIVDATWREHNPPVLSHYTPDTYNDDNVNKYLNIVKRNHLPGRTYLDDMRDIKELYMIDITPNQLKDCYQKL